MLRNLGVKPSKSMPLALVEQSAENGPLELAAKEED
jgi:hypothetical protein